MPPDRTFEIELDVGHPVAGLDQGETLPNPRVGKLDAVAGLAVMDFLLVADGWRCVSFPGGGNSRVRHCRDVPGGKPEHADRARDVLHGLLTLIGERYRKLVPDLVVCRP